MELDVGQESVRDPKEYQPGGSYLPGSPQTLSHHRPYRVIDEMEPVVPGGGRADADPADAGPAAVVRVTTVFLTGSPCPIGCNMCDLHQHTLPGPTPLGAIPRQIDVALRGRERSGWLKLYNSGNFFDPLSIPVRDHQEIISRLEGYSRLVVENHPRFGSTRLRSFRERLPMPLEVAVGLETVQPRWLKRLAKQMTRDEFDAYARRLRSERIDLRVFLIMGVPGVSGREAMRWTRLSVRHAVAASARHISLIPARFGAGWGGGGNELPRWTLDDVSELQRVVLRDVDRRASVTIDLWDLDHAAPQFRELQQRNLTQQPD